MQVLSHDVIEFHPYVFQILAQLLELRPGQFSAAYTALFPPLMLPQLWERRGNVPALVRLIQGITILNLFLYVECIAVLMILISCTCSTAAVLFMHLENENNRSL
jgi:CAS/CSE protein, C-terminus